MLIKMDSDISSIIDLHYYIWEISEDLVYWIFLSLHVYGDCWEDKKKHRETGCAQNFFPQSLTLKYVIFPRVALLKRSGV